MFALRPRRRNNEGENRLCTTFRFQAHARQLIEETDFVILPHYESVFREVGCVVLECLRNVESIRTPTFRTNKPIKENRLCTTFRLQAHARQLIVPFIVPPPWS